MTPSLPTYNAEQFFEYIDNQPDDYPEKPLKAADATIADLKEYIENADTTVYVTVRDDGRRAGTVLSAQIIASTAAELATITTVFNTHVISDITTDADHPALDAEGTAVVNLHFD